MFTRKNVWLLNDAWATDILWYARAVRAMRAKPITDKTSWRFLAAIHGFDAALWRNQGYLAAGEALPPQAVQDRFWNQCQHGGWFFNPWHRGFLLAFEKIVREEVIALNGPKAWALPYWNYFGTAGKTSQALMPTAFASAQWPDGGANPLHVTQRYGPGATALPMDKLDQAKALAESRFVAAAPKGDPGFGGGDVGGFRPHGDRHGRLELQPHNAVHGLIGGHGGLMTSPASAALDPIFWLHHANIDRLWQTWNQGPPARPDPADSFWRHGPSGPGQRQFVMPVSGGPDWVYTPVMVESIRDLGYDYESVDPVGDTPEDRQAPGEQPDEERDVSDGTDVELVGANEAPVVLRAEAPELTRVLLDPAVLDKVVRSRGGGGADDRRADRVFLNLENVRGTSDAAGFGVFLGAPDDQGAAPALVDWVVPFGIEEATDPDGRHAGQGLAYTLEITDLVAGLIGRGVGIEHLDVRLEPMEIFASGAELTIGQISAYRQGT